jgi:hypothetical protein
MRANNVLCNSYNIKDKSLQVSSCRFCVVHSYSFENCIAYFHSSKLVFYAYRLYFLTCDMYMSDLRHIHDPVLSSLKMECIRFFCFTIVLHTYIISLFYCFLSMVDGMFYFFLYVYQIICGGTDIHVVSVEGCLF